MTLCTTQRVMMTATGRGQWYVVWYQVWYQLATVMRGSGVPRASTLDSAVTWSSQGEGGT